MDDGWERSHPFHTIRMETAERLLAGFDPRLKADRIVPLTEGKRNSNYRVVIAGEARALLLRIYEEEGGAWKKEAALRETLRGRVPLQELLFMGRDEAGGGRMYGIFEYAEGRTLADWLRGGYEPGERLFHDIGNALAAIHSIRYERVGLLDERLETAELLSPLADWYGYFLTPLVRSRLGAVTAERLERLVDAGRGELNRLDAEPALVHGDFRPTNLAVWQGRISGILDWEFAMAGHPIADAGQFFRYGEQFPAGYKAAFVRAYNESSVRKLPEDWERLGRLRDLVNLLQMLGAREELPVKYADLNRLIGQTLDLLQA